MVSIYNFLNALQSALGLLGTSTIKGTTGPSIDATTVSGNLKLKLTLDISGLWQPQFEFVLKALELDAVQVLQAQLRDAQEEIKAIKEIKHEYAFLSVCSQTATVNQGIVAWNGTSVNMITHSHFDRSADTTTITIKKRGIYQINCRLGQTNSANTQFMALLIDGTIIAKCVASNANGHQNSAHIMEVLDLAAGSSLTVRCGANSNSLADPQCNRLSIVLLQAL